MVGKEYLTLNTDEKFSDLSDLRTGLGLLLCSLIVVGALLCFTAPSLASSRGEMEFSLEEDRPAPPGTFGSGAPGEPGIVHDSASTGSAQYTGNLPVHRVVNSTGKQNEGLNLPVTQTAILEKTYNGVPQNRESLPETRLESFVFRAGGSAALIYDDEGLYGRPPLSGFTRANTIDSGIHSVNLTTGHRDPTLP